MYKLLICKNWLKWEEIKKESLDTLVQWYKDNYDYFPKDPFFLDDYLKVDNVKHYYGNIDQLIKTIGNKKTDAKLKGSLRVLKKKIIMDYVEPPKAQTTLFGIAQVKIL